MLETGGGIFKVGDEWRLPQESYFWKLSLDAGEL